MTPYVADEGIDFYCRHVTADGGMLNAERQAAIRVAAGVGGGRGAGFGMSALRRTVPKYLAVRQ